MIVLLAIGGVGIQIALIRADLFNPDSSSTAGATAPVEEEVVEKVEEAVEAAPAEAVVVEEKYTWKVTGDGDTFSPTLKNVLSFGDAGAAWT